MVATRWIETTYNRNYLTSNELSNLKAAGIRNLRIPFGIDKSAEPSALLFQEDTPETLNPEALANYDEILDEVLGLGLAVVVTPGDSDARTWLDSAYSAKLSLFWRALGRHLASRDPEKLFIKVGYDPTSANAEAWYAVQRELLAVVRESNPGRTLLVTPSAYTRLGDRDPLRSLLEMTPESDSNVVYDFGFFTPITFTIQGASWREPWLKPLHDLPYPSSPALCAPALEGIADETALKYAQSYCEARYDRALFNEVISAASEWAAGHNVRLANSGLGVYRPHVDDASRLRWLSDVRKAFEAVEIPWAFYNDMPDFSGLDGEPASRDFEPAVADALFGP